MKENFGWQFWIATIIGLIGAMAWIPQILEWSLKPKIYGKVLSQYENPGKTLATGIEGTIVLQKISLFVKNKDFVIKKMRVYIKLPSNSKEVEATVITPRSLYFKLDNGFGKKEDKRLNIPTSDFLSTMSLFPKNQSVTGYLVWQLDFEIHSNYEYIRYEFFDYSNKKLNLLINSKDIIATELAHEEEIWESI
jgi:hypothetical protein